MTAHPIQAIFSPASFTGLDRATPPRETAKAFGRAKKTEEAYARRLRKVAVHIGDIVSGFDPGRWESADAVGAILRQYADTILRPWARSVATKMVAEVDARDRRAWASAGRKIGAALRNEIDATPVGEVIRARLAEQVDLITSLPRDAAERVHRLTLEGISNSARASEIAKEIMRTGEVTKARASMIARTEVGRTATELMRARALSVGSTHYVWKTAGDSDVRADHKKLNGKVFAWGEPPVADERSGAKAHPGSIYSCRCYAAPIISDD